MQCIRTWRDNMSPILIGVLVVVALIAIYFIAQYNSFVSMRNLVEEAFSTMDVYLKKRFDLIPNVVETVKGYATHEKETLDAVISARNAVSNASSTEAQMAAEGDLSKVMGRLFALTESYPDLKANVQFMDLQQQLKAIETEIAQSRKYYNGTVRQYNTKREQFPSNIVANMFNFQAKTLYEVSDATERENVKVSF